MDRSSLKLSAEIAQSFVHIRVIDPKGNVKIMARCKVCHFIINDTTLDKWKHAKRTCMKRYQFKWNDVTKIGKKQTISCMVCNKTYSTTTTDFMEKHRRLWCSAQQEVAEMQQNTPQVQREALQIRQKKIVKNPSSIDSNTTNKQISSPTLSYNHNRSVLRASTQNTKEPNVRPTVSTSALNQSPNITVVNLNSRAAAMINLDEFQYKKKFLTLLPANKKIECIECRVCKKYFTINLALNHRAQCKIVQGNRANENSTERVDRQIIVLDDQQHENQSDENREPIESGGLEMPESVEEEPEILFSVQTVHTENTNVQQNNSSAAEAQIYSEQFGGKRKLTSSSDGPRKRACFICNTTNGSSFKSLYGTTSAYTNTSIYKFIWKWLGGTSVRNDITDATMKKELICTDCLDTVNDYDAAMVTAKQCTTKLCDKLSKTEAYFEQLKKGGSNKEENSTAKSASTEGQSARDDISESDKFEETSQSQICLAPDGEVINLCDDN